MKANQPLTENPEREARLTPFAFRLFHDTPQAAPLLVFLAALGLYLYALQPSLSWGDGVRLQREALTGESFILAELVDRPFAPDPYPFAKLGIAAWDHPLYVVLGYGLSRIGPALFPGTNPLWWVNLISAVFGAGTVMLVFVLGKRWSGSGRAAAAGAALLAVSHTFWWHAATPEVYTLHAFMLLAALLGFSKFTGGEGLPALYASAFVFGLALSNHFLAGLALPAVAASIARNTGRYRKLGAFLPRTLLTVFALGLLGASPIIIQGLRMLRTFPVGELFGPVTGTTFFASLPPVPLWQSALTYILLLTVQFSPLGLALGAAGLPAAWRAGNRLLALLYAVFTAFSVLYRVPDQFAFHLTSYVMFALAVPYGWLALRQHLRPGVFKIYSGLLAAQVLLAPLFYPALVRLLPVVGIDEAAFGVPQIGTGVRDGLDFYVNPNKHGDDQAYGFGKETLEALPPDALVLAQWYTDTDEYFIFRYFAVVEGLRPDVEIEGWPQEEPFNFDPQIAVARIAAEIDRRPVYLASLSDEYYRASALLSAYCIYPEFNLYRITNHWTEDRVCLE